MIILAFLAGIYIGFGCQLSTVVKTDCGGKGTCNYLGGAAFSVGLMLIVGAGTELFTGNCLILVGALACCVPVLSVLKDWFVVWLFHFVGSIFVQAIIFGGGSNGTQMENNIYGATACSVCEAKMEIDCHMMFFEGILANILVCLAVIMAVASKSMVGKILSCFFPLAAFVASGFEHSIADMSFFAQCTILSCGK
eukprot:9822313-Ditylum_brightwellii.AAC.1